MLFRSTQKLLMISSRSRQCLQIVCGMSIVLILFVFKSSYFRNGATWHEKLLKNAEEFSKLTEVDLRLVSKLTSIHESCGEVCDTNKTGSPGKYYNQIRKTVNCRRLFENPDIDAYSEYENAPMEIPSYLLPEFTHGGKLKVITDYRDESHSKGFIPLWTKDHIEKFRLSFKTGQLNGSYGYGAIDTISKHLDDFGNIEGKSVLVIGSQTPWLEAVLLEKGAKHVTTFDYNKIRSEHPQLETITPAELAKKYFEGVRYDAMATFSSIEHSGLGRYGDMLNPWGDLIAMARSWCLVTPGGYGLVGVPTGKDMIGFNSHRIYGPLAFEQLFANWEVVYTETDFKEAEKFCYFCYQPVHSLRRI